MFYTPKPYIYGPLPLWLGQDLQNHHWQQLPESQVVVTLLFTTTNKYSMLLLNEGGINQKTRHAPSSESSEGNDLLFKHDMYIIINYTAFGLLLCISFLLCNKGWTIDIIYLIC